ncbi:ABC transporter permease [Sedimentibacter sp. MB31-C6]|uniref:ABC transporter permease n=1 Tax=Sedimentibacter sp. MB31-C6 TaxID=3109366 RepID=UPI002DDCC1C7|nr:ABC transporter permease [Sedimentibacter sp. MB36-C1]WSI05185.1 ABC transporter permease [Sedimentibacter sp. MB36-C1]
MNIKSVTKMAFQSIFSNKMRTFLTMLGIIIGVFAVVVLISIGQGATSGVTDSISSMGSNIISINIFDRRKSIIYNDVYDFEKLDGVKNVTPVYNSNATVKYDLETTTVNINGGNENYMNINNYKIGSGRKISPVDVDYRNKVAIIGLTTAEDLFGKDNPLNKDISINGEKYTVVGVLQDKESSIAGDSNDIVIVPVTTLMRQNSTKEINSITIQANSSEESTLAKENIENYLFDYFEDEDSYMVFSQDEMLDVINETTAMLTAMLGGIAGISLLVGGIGIMNIMLVTVTERTREIGIRKAIGAGRVNILIQFLIESSVMSGVGGIIGAVLGVIVSSAISDIMAINYVVNIPVIIGAFGFSLAVGVFFGLYPANKASKLKPVDALRYE